MSRPTQFLRVRPSRAGVRQLVVAFGAVTAALCLGARTVNALDAGATPNSASAATASTAWCVETSDGSAPLDCTYDNYLTCALAAIRAGGLCKTGDTVVASRPRPAAPPKRRPQATNASNASRTGEPSLTVAEREKLFRAFVEWNHRRSDQ